MLERWRYQCPECESVNVRENVWSDSWHCCECHEHIPDSRIIDKKQVTA
jgi:hypothetical protein